VGRDSLGDIACRRRFQHFIDFRQALTQRYPGLYIPPVPPKKFSNKTENALVTERQYFLNLFLRECSSLKYLSQSGELQTFLRPTGDLQKGLDKIARPNTDSILQMYRATIPINENYSEIETKQFEANTNGFVKEQ